MSDTKTCFRCGFTGPREGFLPDRNLCYPCKRAYYRAYEQRTKLPALQGQAPQHGPRHCVRCGVEFTPRMPSVETCRPCLLAQVGLPADYQPEEERHA